VNLWVTQGGQTVREVLNKRCNVYLISNDGRHLLVDCGRERRWKRLRRALERLDVCAPGRLSGLVLTHAHFDHAENAATVKAQFGAPIIVHESEAGHLERGESPPVRGSRGVMKFLLGLVAPEWTARLFSYRPAIPDIAVGDTYSLDALGFTGTLLHTPGHTAGSVSVIVDDEVAMVGDAMFGEWFGSIYPPFAVDPAEMVRSWGKLLGTGCSVFLPSHGTPRVRELVAREYERYAELATQSV
jgi:hydroxyacylglutathione hydrolase